MKLQEALSLLRPAIAAKANEILDEWQPDETGFDEIFGTGGACDAIAEAIGEIVGQALPEIAVLEGGQDGDDHNWVIVHDGRHAFEIDIPHWLYERGGGYNWRKIPGARITPENVVIERLDVTITELEDR